MIDQQVILLIMSFVSWTALLTWLVISRFFRTEVSSSPAYPFVSNSEIPDFPPSYRKCVLEVKGESYSLTSILKNLLTSRRIKRFNSSGKSPKYLDPPSHEFVNAIFNILFVKKWNNFFTKLLKFFFYISLNFSKNLNLI